MTIYDLIYVLESNMNHNIIVENDALLNYDTNEEVTFEGEVYDFRMTDLYDEIQDEEVTDLYTLPDGRLVICYNNEEEK